MIFAIVLLLNLSYPVRANEIMRLRGTIAVFLGVEAVIILRQACNVANRRELPSAPLVQAAGQPEA